MFDLTFPFFIFLLPSLPLCFNSAPPLLCRDGETPHDFLLGGEEIEIIIYQAKMLFGGFVIMGWFCRSAPESLTGALQSEIIAVHDFLFVKIVIIAD